MTQEHSLVLVPGGSERMPRTQAILLTLLEIGLLVALVMTA